MSDSFETKRLRIVGVHGVHHYVKRRPPEEAALGYARDWTGHLARGLSCAPDRFELAFAYYAPALNQGRSTAQGSSGDEDLDDPLAVELLGAYLAALGAEAPVVQGALTMPLRYAAAWIAERFPGTTTAFVRVFFREVAEYLRAPDHPARVQARDTVIELIRRQQPDVVIAHSLGTIVTYEALHAIPETPIPLLITLGSPLALPHAVHPRLLPAPVDDPEHGGQALGTRPSGVRRWVNIADPGDPVAIPPRLARGFQGIALDLTDTINHHVGFHNAANYLSAPATAATLAPLLGI